MGFEFSAGHLEDSASFGGAVLEHGAKGAD
jgi:hypothetical protein